MRQSGWISYIFVVLGTLLICGACYAIISYSGTILGGALDFFASNSSSKLMQCGLSVPQQLTRLRTDLVTAILPTIYLGFPFYLIVLAFIMFIGGFYYHKAKMEYSEETISAAEQEAMRRVVSRIISEKTKKKPLSSSPKDANEPDSSEKPESHESEYSQ